MSRRSHKQSNVVPINLADELDELMSSESIKPNIAFLGLAAEPSTETVSNSEFSSRPADPDSGIQPRLVAKFESVAVREMSERDEARSTSSSGAFIAAKDGRSITSPAADFGDFDDPPSIITAPGDSNVAPTAHESELSSASGDVISRSPSSNAVLATGADKGGAHTNSSPGVQEKQLPGRPTKIHKCSKAQDGHSHLEEVLYGVLRRAGRPEDGPSGNVITQAGSSFLCKETRVHKRNLGTVLRRLVFKQSIEILDYERSTTRTARRYRVFSYGEILKRRREAGLEWVVRRRGVEFVNPATGEPLFVDPGAVDAPESSPGAVTATPPAVTATDSPAFTSGDSDAVRSSASHAVTAPPLGKEARESTEGMKQRKEETTSSVDLSLVSQALQRHWQTDHAAVQQLIRSCVAVRPDCTTSEIISFIEEKGYILAKNVRTFTNPVGFLLSSIPKCFEGDTFERWRERERLAEEHRLAEQRRQKEENRAALRWMTEHSKETLDNPRASDRDRRRAEQFLAENPAPEDEGMQMADA